MQKYLSYTFLLVAVLSIVRLLLPSCEYVGGLNDSGQPEGKGVGLFYSGFLKIKNAPCSGIYLGEWKDEKREGKGDFYCQGNFFTGEWRDNDLRKGRCKIKNISTVLDKIETWTALADEFRKTKTAEYEGYFFCLMPDGKGRIKCGSYEYEGQWSFGKKSGFGSENGEKLALYANGKKQDVNVITDKRIYGTDLSHYQPIVHWDRMYVAVDSSYTCNDTISKQIGVIPLSFVFLKATEGKEYVDAEYEKHCDWAERYGIPHGAYHFFNQRFATVDEQIRNFTSHVKVKKGDLPPVLDIEMFGVSTDSLLIWTDAVEKRLGVKPIVYANERIARIHVDRSKLKDHVLWHARYGAKPTRVFDIHQYSEKGKSPAVDKHEIDLDTLSNGMTIERLMVK